MTDNISRRARRMPPFHRATGDFNAIARRDIESPANWARATLSPNPRSQNSMKRALLLLAFTATTLSAQTSNRPAAAPFNVVEASIADMRTALEQRRTTSRELVLQYLSRIALYEDRLHAVITVNP